MADRDGGLRIFIRVDHDHAAELVDTRLGDHGVDKRVRPPHLAQGREDARVLGTLLVGGLAEDPVVGRADARRRLACGSLEGLPLLVHPVEDAHERVGHPGVELRAAAGAQFLPALLVGEGGPVHTA